LDLWGLQHFAVNENMQILIRLFPDGFHYFGMTVTRIANTDAANQIQINFSIGVIEIHAFGPHDLQSEGRSGSLCQVAEK
jgi:hypothetical protein